MPGNDKLKRFGAKIRLFPTKIELIQAKNAFNAFSSATGWSAWTQCPAS
jgi:hypothetical protein